MWAKMTAALSWTKLYTNIWFLLFFSNFINLNNAAFVLVWGTGVIVSYQVAVNVVYLTFNLKKKTNLF